MPDFMMTFTSCALLCALPQFESFYSPIMDGQKFESNHERLSSRFLHQSEVNRYSPDSEYLLTTPSVGERTLIGLSPIKSLYCVSTMIEAWFPVVTEQWRELGSKYIRYVRFAKWGDHSFGRSMISKRIALEKM